MAKHSKGKHTKPKAAVKFGRKKKSQEESSESQAPVEGGDVLQEASPVVASAQPGAFQPATIVIEKKERDKRKIAKRIGITFLVTVLLVAAIYLAGVFVFSTRFMPNTHIQNIDLSLKTPEEVQKDFEGKVGSYSFKVKGKGLNINVTSAQAGLAIDAASMTQTIASAQDPWMWPVEVFQERDVTHALTDSLTASTLSDVVRRAVDDVNATAKDPQDAYVQYDSKAHQYEIVPEVPGSKLDYEKVFGSILVSAMNLDDEVVILGDCLIEPSVYRDDKRVVALNNEANDLVRADIQLVLGGQQVARISADDISQWVSITPEMKAVLDDAAMQEWVGGLSEQFNTVGGTRTFARADGKEVTVKGGDYGWKVDSEDLAAQVVNGVLDRLKGVIEVPAVQEGKGFTSVGSRDWGTRYIDVDISEQHVRFYGDDGAIIWESDCVTGAPTADRATPQGVWYVKQKASPSTLIGRPNEEGEPEYETKVEFWMPFKGNAVGFHDANWQSGFGGSRYRSGSGSHGCVNLPYDKAQELYGIIESGDVVVVHD